MKKTASLLLALSLSLSAHAVTYTDLTKEFCDADHGVIYDGKGGFSVDSAPDTTLDVTIDISALENYLSSNDYKQGPAVTWSMAYDKAPYGIADDAKGFMGYWNKAAWGKAGELLWEKVKTAAGAEGKVTLSFRNHPAQGVSISHGDEVLFSAAGLRSRHYQNSRTLSYWVNINYVSAVSINNDSTLDTSSYEAPADYSQPFVSKSSGRSLGRLMFLGDSITHGVCDMTYRWAFFKLLVDNGIEAEIVGPRSGYTGNFMPSASTNVDFRGDMETSYSGVLFPNVHLAQSSGRTHNILAGSNVGMSGVNYGGHSVSSAADAYNCNTFVCMMGTNDLLSDGGYTPDDFVKKMTKLVGGDIRYQASSGSYIRKPKSGSLGNMGKIAEAALRDKGDVLYVLSIPCWTQHVNNNEPERHVAVMQYNEMLQDWVKEYNKAHPNTQVKYVESNTGLVDYSEKTPFYGHASFFRKAGNRGGCDGLHPSEQGALIIAANLARAMGLPGRTVGLPKDDGMWKPLTSKSKAVYGSPDKGCSLLAGLKAGSASVALGRDEGAGELTVTDTHICWGDKVLYCREKDAPAAVLCIVYVHGMESANIPAGYYVWLDGQLIGQALPDNAEAFNGIRCTGAARGRAYAQGGYAPPAQARKAAKRGR